MSSLIPLIVNISQCPGDVNENWLRLSDKYNLGITMKSSRYKPRVRVVSLEESMIDEFMKEPHIIVVFDGEIPIYL